MAIAPIFSSPCDLANRLPVMVAEFLDVEQSLKRRFREDSITDIFVASMLSLPGNRVVVLTPPESRTGGDFDIVVLDPLSVDAVQFRIQAKRLTPHKHNWTTGSYVELAHPHNSGKQSESLFRSVGNERILTFPLYAFYNPAHVCAASGGAVSGIELASGWEVRERIKAITKAKPKRLPLKRIGSLQPLFFPLSTILCAPSNDVRASDIPSPQDAKTAVTEAIEARAGLDAFDRMHRPSAPRPILQSAIGGDGKRADDAPGPTSARELRDHLPRVVRHALERRDERIIVAKVKRPKILLIAGE